MAGPAPIFPTNPSEDNHSFRKGVILGLTLAEISLLVVFVLLLVFGALLKHAEAQLEAAKQSGRRADAAEAQMRRMLHQFSPTTPPPQVDAWVRELVEAAAKNGEIAQARAQLKASAAELAEIEGAAAQAQLIATASDRSASAVPPAERRRAIVAALPGALAELKARRDAQSAIEGAGKDNLASQIVKVDLENQQLKGAVANASRRLAAAGKGTEKPACWATPDGRPEYIFEARLGSDGIRLHDRAIPNRRAQEATLPIKGIAFDRPLDASAFRAQTRPLFDWGEERGCRFFVDAIDATGPAEKATFKTRLRTLEDHFYKFLSG